MAAIIKQLFGDAAESQLVYPVTSIYAVRNDSGQTLNYILDQKQDKLTGTAHILVNDDNTVSLVIDSALSSESEHPIQNKVVTAKISDVESIAKGAIKAWSVSNYQTLINVLNAASATDYNVGQNIYVTTLEVPDTYISKVETSSVTYTYVSDAQFITDVNTACTSGGVGLQIGYYRVAFLETQKVDLTEYVKNTDYATSSKGGTLMINNTYGFNVSSGVLTGYTKSYSEYLSSDATLGVSKGTLENVLHAAKSALDSPCNTNIDYNLGSKDATFEIALPTPTDGNRYVHVTFTASAAFTPTVTTAGSEVIKGETMPTTTVDKFYSLIWIWQGSFWEFHVNEM